MAGDATEAPLTYGSYLAVDELLQLQRTRSRPEHPDELLFIVVHQASELWFKVLLHELEVRRREAEQANHAKTRFLASVSHDLRQPMHSIALLSGALRQHVAVDAAADALAEIGTSVQAATMALAPRA